MDYEARRTFFAYANYRKRLVSKEVTIENTNHVRNHINFEELNGEKDFNYDQMFSIKEGSNIREVILVNTKDQIDIWVN